MVYYKINPIGFNRWVEKRSKNMTESFKQKVIENGIYDTERYRWIYDINTNTIQRLPIQYLDTTRALSDWEIVESEVL